MSTAPHFIYNKTCLRICNFCHLAIKSYVSTVTQYFLSLICKNLILSLLLDYHYIVMNKGIFTFLEVFWQYRNDINELKMTISFSNHQSPSPSYAYQTHTHTPLNLINKSSLVQVHGPCMMCKTSHPTLSTSEDNPLITKFKFMSQEYQIIHSSQDNSCQSCFLLSQMEYPFPKSLLSFLFLCQITCLEKYSFIL